MRRSFRLRCFAARRDERGAILVMSTMGVMLAVVAAALAVDTGGIAQERRRDQRVADLAALDAARDIADRQSLAEASAARNGFSLGPNFTVTAVEGIKVNGSTCQEIVGSGTVCVRVQSRKTNNFLRGSRDIVATAMAGTRPESGFWMGSSLATATIDNELPLMNTVLGKMLGATGALSLVSYQGLAAGNVSLEQLKATSQFNAGSTNGVLNQTTTLSDLLTATATALDNQGTVESHEISTKVLQLRDSTTNSDQFKLGDIMEIAQGYEDKAASGDINVLQLITAAAAVANKDNFIDAGTVMTVPNPLGGGAPALQTKLGLKVIEGPKFYRGPEQIAPPFTAANSIHTGQVELTLTVKLPDAGLNFNANVLGILPLNLGSILGTSPLKLTGEIPVKFTGAGADAALTDIRCGATGGITTTMQRSTITTSVAATLDLFAQSAAVLPANIRAKINVGPTSATAGAPSSPDVTDFNWDADFWPDTVKTTPGAPVNVTLNSTNVTLNTSGFLGLDGLTSILGGAVTATSVLDATINPLLTPIVSSTLSKLTGPTLKALGLSIGPVDQWAPEDWFSPNGCGAPALMK